MEVPAGGGIARTSIACTALLDLTLSSDDDFALPADALESFDNGYWYVADLRIFAKQLGVPRAGSLRKNELEAAIRGYLTDGEIAPPPGEVPVRSRPLDQDAGLALALQVRRYVGNRATTDFLLAEARKQSPGFKKKPGVSYRLNRWREAQIAAGRSITYGDLVRQLITLNSAGAFERVPHGRYVNFVADYFAHHPKAARADVLRAWRVLKSIDAPKTYESWKLFASSNGEQG